MKAECTANNFVSLTKGKIYEIVESDLIRGLVLLEDDDGDILWFNDDIFILLPEVNLPPMTGEYKEAVQGMLDNFNAKPITYKDFLASMPKSADACVMMFGDNSIMVNVYGLEFDCPTEERAEEVYAALITLFKEDV